MISHKISTEPFALLDDSLFDKLSNPIDMSGLGELENMDAVYNYCPDCEILMDLSGNDYQCSNCGLTSSAESERGRDIEESSGGSIRITTGPNRGRFRNVNSDYSKTQKKNLLDQLLMRQSQYTGAKFPRNVLNAAADQYNRNQKVIKEDCLDDNGVVKGQKKFVRRGSMKDEILAALIYFEGIREGSVRKKKDIATFMGLSTCGFARGEDILRNLEAEGLINIPVNDEPIEGFVERYLEALGLDNPDYSNFIVDIVKKSETAKIGMGSQISSKIVGSIWIIITQHKLKITSQTLEKSADETKKNTFMKFYKVVFENINAFAEIFRTYNIPYA